MSRKLSRPLAVVGLAIVVLAPFSGGAAASAHHASAKADSALVRLTTSAGTISLGTDDAQAVTGAVKRAFARFITGKVAGETIGATERETTKQGERASGAVGDENLKLGSFISLETTGATIDTSVTSSVTSVVEAELGGAELLGGLVTLDGGGMKTTARSNTTGSRVTRTIEIAEVEALSLGDFLAALGVNPLQLACGAVESVGALLAISTGSTCEDIAAAGDLFDDAIEVLQGARQAIEDARAVAQASLDSLESTLAGVNVNLDAARDTLATLEAAHEGIVAQRKAAEATLAGLESSLTSLQSQRATLASQRTALSNTYPRSEVEAERSDTANMCAGLSGTDRTACETTALLTTFPSLALTYGAGALPGTFTGARDAIVARLDEIIGQFDAFDAQIASLDAQIATKNSEIDGVEASIAALTVQIDAAAADVTDQNALIDGLEAQIASLQAQISSFVSQLALLAQDLLVLDATGAADTTCSAVTGAIGRTSELAPSLAGALSAINTTLETRCNEAADAVVALLGSPLISLTGVSITIDVWARAGDPVVSVSGTIGTVKIGGQAPVAVELPAVSDEIPAVRTIVDDALASVASSLGVDLPTPDVQFLVTNTSKGQNDAGAWVAHGSVTLLHIGFPAQVLSVPDVAPMALLDGMKGLSGPDGAGSAGASGAGMMGAPRGMILGAMNVETPGLTLDVGTFNADGSFVPPAGAPDSTDDDDDDEDGGSRTTTRAGSSSLPRTGVGRGIGTLAALAMLAAAALVRRYGLVITR